MCSVVHFLEKICGERRERGKGVGSEKMEEGEWGETR